MESQREYRRIKVNFIVSYQVKYPLSLRISMGWNKKNNAQMLDISEGGACILTNHDIPVSTDIFIKFVLISFNLNNGGEKIISMGTLADVRYNLLSQKNKHRLGICFIGMNNKDRDLIADFIKHQK